MRQLGRVAARFEHEIAETLLRLLGADLGWEGELNRHVNDDDRVIWHLTAATGASAPYQRLYITQLVESGEVRVTVEFWRDGKRLTPIVLPAQDVRLLRRALDALRAGLPPLF
jgi:hypothetical protein